MGEWSILTTNLKLFDINIWKYMEHVCTSIRHSWKIIIKWYSSLRAVKKKPASVENPHQMMDRQPSHSEHRQLVWNSLGSPCFITHCFCYRLIWRPHARLTPNHALRSVVKSRRARLWPLLTLSPLSRDPLPNVFTDWWAGSMQCLASGEILAKELCSSEKDAQKRRFYPVVSHSG